MHQLQRINIKYFTEVSKPSVPLEPFLGILESWKKESEEWLDIADYLHLSEGTAVLLFGNKRFFSVDRSNGKYGLLYSQRSGLTGSLKERFQSALEQSQELTQKIMQHPDYPEALGKTIHALEIRVNDRTLLSKTSHVSDLLEPVLEESLNDFLPQGSFETLSFTEEEGLWGTSISLKTPWILEA